MVDIQQGDVILRQIADDGEICVEGGIVAMDGGLGTAAYLSLFGGNENDAGGQKNTKFSWWGNVDETIESRKYRSLTQNLLRSIPAVSNNLRRIEAAVVFDLKWMTDDGIATSILATASLVDVNRVHIVVDIIAQGEESSINFTENWKAS